MALWIEVYLNGSQYSDSYAAPFLILSSSPNPSASYADSRFSFNQHRFSAVHVASRFSFSQSIPLPLPLPRAVSRFLFPLTLPLRWTIGRACRLQWLRPSAAGRRSAAAGRRSVPARSRARSRGRTSQRPSAAAGRRQRGGAASSRCPSFLSTIDDVPRAFLGLFPFLVSGRNSRNAPSFLVPCH